MGVRVALIMPQVTSASISLQAHMVLPYAEAGWNPIQVPASINGSEAANAYTATGYATYVFLFNERPFKNSSVVKDLQELLEIGLTLTEAGIGFTLSISTDESHVPADLLRLPKSLSPKGNSRSMSWSFAVNESTGERNETGEKRLNRVLAAIKESIEAPTVVEVAPIKIVSKSTFNCPNCGKAYQSRTGLWNHSKKNC